MFDTYEVGKWDRIKEVRTHICEALHEIDKLLTEEQLDTNQWLDAYRFIHKACDLFNVLEKNVLVVRCRRLDESEFRKLAKTGK